MKITKEQLKQIIKEKVEATLVDEGLWDKVKGAFGKKKKKGLRPGHPWEKHIAAARQLTKNWDQMDNREKEFERLSGIQQEMQNSWDVEDRDERIQNMHASELMDKAMAAAERAKEGSLAYGQKMKAMGDQARRDYKRKQQARADRAVDAQSARNRQATADARADEKRRARWAADDERKKGLKFTGGQMSGKSPYAENKENKMKITKEKLKQIIKEELEKLSEESTARRGLNLTNINQFPHQAPEIRKTIMQSLGVSGGLPKKIYNTNNQRLVLIDEVGDIYIGKELPGAREALESDGYRENLNLSVPGSN